MGNDETETDPATFASQTTGSRLGETDLEAEDYMGRQLDDQGSYIAAHSRGRR